MVSKHRLLGGTWSSDNRSGISGTLHRVSSIVDLGSQSIVGLALRMAHPIYGMTSWPFPYLSVVYKVFITFSALLGAQGKSGADKPKMGTCLLPGPFHQTERSIANAT
jgi:hypothetical protein